ncbi:MAG: L,D-transpeptidase [Ramlibacter sp.]|nr:L,D-transpeptidase [Ramlibacter sp.]
MCRLAVALEGPADLATRYSEQVRAGLVVPADEARRYGRLADDALARAGILWDQPQYLLVVDRDPWVQAVFLLWRTEPGGSVLVGASPASTGLGGSFDHFETPLGVFEHSLANPDYRAAGTLNRNGIRGYGARGMRVFDFGWQRAPKGWGDGAVSDMRLQLHATDPDLLERRLGTAQSKGCIRIPAALNRFLDRFGVLDADYEQAARDRSAPEAGKLWVLDPQREPVAGAGRYLVVVESGRSERPDWSPAPALSHRRPAAPAPAPTPRPAGQ